MIKRSTAAAAVVATLSLGFAATASTGCFAENAMSSEKTVTVGGAAMYPSRNIIQNAVNSKDHTTLVAAVKAAGLVDTLSGPGPFTVFAPTNEAFGKLPAGTVSSLVKPENKAALTKILHLSRGRRQAFRGRYRPEDQGWGRQGHAEDRGGENP